MQGREQERMDAKFRRDQREDGRSFGRFFDPRGFIGVGVDGSTPLRTKMPSTLPRGSYRIRRDFSLDGSERYPDDRTLTLTVAIRWQPGRSLN